MLLELLNEYDIQRFWEKVEKPDNNELCWFWRGAINADGYGHFRINKLDKKTMLKAHRVSYALMVEEPSLGMHLHHLCDHRDCVNPNHIEQLSPRDHVDISTNMGNRREYCPNGHEMTDENTYVLASKGRRCIQCMDDHRRKYNIVNGSNQFVHKHAIDGV